MFTVVEIDKTSPFVEKFTPHTPYVFKSILTVGGAYNIDNYWTTIFGADGAFNETDKNITSVVLNNIFDVEQVDNLGDLITQENSFLFDFDTQELYIHFPHNLTPQVTTIATGQGWGYCSDTVRYFRNQLYRPIVLSVPALSDSTDPLQYGIIAFGGGTVTLVNDGSFDEDEKLYGNNIRIKMGKDGDNYNDLITMFSGYIKDYTTTTQEFIIDVADKRERLQLKYPNETIQVIDKYIDGEGYEYKEQVIPDGYGTVIQVPAYPLQIGDGQEYLSFDGIDDYVSIPYNSALYPTSQLRIEASAYMETWEYFSPSADVIVSCTQIGGWNIAISVDIVRFQIHIGGSYSFVTYPLASLSSGWHDFVGTFDGRYVKLYVDDVLVDTVDKGGLFSISYSVTDGILIGAELDTGGAPADDSFFRGYIKDVAIYSDAAGTTPVATWGMQEGTGATIYDATNSYDGTIHGATWETFAGVSFRWGLSTTSITKVYVEQDERISEVTPISSTTDGVLLLSDTNAYIDGDNTKGLRKVYVTGVMRNLTNPADIIVDLNNRLFGVEYNTSNYNTTELEQEKALLADVGLYMDKPRKVYEWIEELQNGTNIGFRYEDTEKRTIRLDLPMRSKILDIQPIDIRNADMPIKRNAELYASSALVKYSKNWRNDSYKQTENKDYEQQVVDEHRVKKVQSYESLLTSKVDADSKALTVMKDIHKVRPIVTLRLDSSLYPKPRIFDMLTAKVSLIQGSAPITHNYSYVVGDDFVLGDDYVIIGENRGETITEMYSYKENYREYLGDIAGQVIGINWLPATSEVEIEIRERDL